ncbi:hypothetical protein [uncultured Kordia sp.]|uniref:hypothetical protein n=1 Tax=uncultured Kordia sp. TaxID=507699 RepID=UPI0026245375|nr:hypothetical protein [uncultured Kordia sp.]
MTDKEEKVFENSEEIFNWTYPGATLYYRDCELKSSVTERYKEGQILRNGFFLDVSWKGAGLDKNTRFIVASSKAAKLYKVNPDVEKYGHCCINANSYFKVLNIYKLNGKTQIFLLHIPATGVDFFSKVISNIDDQFIERAKKSFDEKIVMSPLPELLEKTWVERTNFPVGMDAYDVFYPLDSLTPLQKQAESLYNGIRNLTNDTTDINVSKITKKESPKGFFGKLFRK